MDQVVTVIGHLLMPLTYPFTSSQRIYWLYLITALMIAVVVYFVRRRRKGRSLAGFGKYCFPKSVYGHRSARVDYVYFIINRIVFTPVFAFLVAGSVLASSWAFKLLSTALGEAAPLAPSVGIDILFTVVSVLALDAGVFIAHYLFHKVPVLWEFHKVHHSAEVLTPITVYRMHPIDDLITMSMGGAMMGLVDGAFTYFCGPDAKVVTLMNLNVVVFVFYVVGYNLRHTHVWVAFPAPFDRIFISPALHQIHHSDKAEHLDKNLGLIFAFWDWFAGTLFLPARREELSFGLAHDSNAEYHGVWRLYTLPFKKSAGLLWDKMHATR